MSNGNEKSIRLIFDHDLDRCQAGCTSSDCEQIPDAFVGYEIDGLFYSSLMTLPAWARSRARPSS